MLEVILALQMKSPSPGGEGLFGWVRLTAPD